MERSFTLKLLPFFSSVVIYFKTHVFAASDPSYRKAILKCLPIYCLVYIAVSNRKMSSESKGFSKKIAIGLALSSVGDAFLVWPDLFLPVISILVTGLDDIFIVAVPAYALLLTTMAWRATARYLTSPSRWRLISALGSVLFLLSDAVLGVNKFLTPIPYGEFIVMMTYYGAQLCISLGTFEVVLKKQK
ncbi:lysoplasmalogenase TMEM86A-like isoform X2 [Artemia franciscana]|uniref:lysoplasmalogenase TMEM86A-like isoform X2 n=1 Tax=Artemia franciscana TaxID=6661 RepID=UPI0032DA2489